VGADTGGD